MMSMDDLRFAIRRLVKQPGATIASIVTLACAIGAAVAASSLLSALLLHPLPVTDPDRLVVIGWQQVSPAHSSGSGQMHNEHICPVFPAVQSSGIFAEVAAGGSASALVVVDGASKNRPIYFASHDFFETIGVRLQAGRGFARADDEPGAAPVAILSDRFWRSVLNARPDV